MKKLSIAILLFILSAGLSFAQKRTVILGKIINSTISGIKISHIINPIDKEWKDFKSTLDKKGNYKIVFTLDKPERMVFNIGDKYNDIFMEPGDSINYNTDFKDFYAKTKYSGKGVVNNNFKLAHYKTFFHMFVDQEFSRKIIEKGREAPPEVFTPFMDSLSNYYLSFLESHKTEVTPAFYQHYKVSATYSLLFQKLIYPYMNIRSRLKNGASYSFTYYLPYYSFLDSVSIANDSLLNHEIYFQFISYYLGAKRNSLYQSLSYEKDPQDPIKHSAFSDYYLSTFLFTGKTKDYLQANAVYFSLNYENKNSREKVYALFKQDVKDTALNAIIDKAYATNKDRRGELQVGEQFPDFSTNDIDGKKVSLSDLKGKVVYVDFWGSWCGPCMSEMPKSKELKEKLKSQQDQIVYLYFNCMDTDERWKNAVEKNKIEGVHLKTNEQELKHVFAVNGFPSYFLLDQSGKIMNTYIRPGDEKTEAAILGLLKK